MNDTTGKRTSETKAGAASLPTGITDQEPTGKSASAIISPSSNALSGVLGAGFTTIGAPTAMAGATLCATRFIGKLNGEMPRTGPCANLRMIAIRPAVAASVSRRCSSPENLRTSSAAHRKTKPARPASARAQINGLPFSSRISCAISSARSVSRFDINIRASARCAAVVRRAACLDSQAPATACSTCAAVGT